MGHVPYKIRHNPGLYVMLHKACSCIQFYGIDGQMLEAAHGTILRIDLIPALPHLIPALLYSDSVYLSQAQAASSQIFACSKMDLVQTQQLLLGCSNRLA